MDPRILEAEPYYNNGSNKVFLLLKIYWLLYLKFLQPFFPSGRDKSESLFSRERIVGGEWWSLAPLEVGIYYLIVQQL